MSSKKKSRDLVALGAALMPTRALLALVGVKPEDASAAERALGLVGGARDSALHPLASGPRLIAALELGRRAWMLPSPAGRRVRSPVDVAAICAPRVNAEQQSFALALDRRLTVARVVATDLDPVNVLHATLAAGVTRVVVGIGRAGHPAVPTADDTALAERLQSACALVDVALLDVVLLGDDGFASLARLGILRALPNDPRYR